MRIIGGKFKRRPLKKPRGKDIRPTADMQREALYNILSNRIMGLRVLDLYAGTGAMGIEALSRGAKSVVFIDNARMAIRLINENIRLFQIENSSQVIKWNISKNLSCIKDQLFDLVFMDPPYHHTHVQNTLSHLQKAQCLNEESIIIAEHAIKDSILVPDGLELYDHRKYGKSQFSFFRTIQ
ncbi:Ribosomal RNA small subunit methyltransferase D, partial [Candidatus Magnetomorum sp. HK-1]